MFCAGHLCLCHMEFAGAVDSVSDAVGQEEPVESGYFAPRQYFVYFGEGQGEHWYGVPPERLASWAADAAYLFQTVVSLRRELCLGGAVRFLEQRQKVVEH